MALLEQWQKVAYNEKADRGELQRFWQRYFLLEKGVYEQLLTNPEEKVEGTVKELAEKYNLSVMEMTGFLDGINDMTGRKIIVDTYGGKGAHGGGAFSGKDPSKVDRSAAYAARHIAKNLVAAGVADEMLVQVSYAIGVARPINIYVNTYGRSHVNMSDGEIARKIDELFDLRPKAIEDRLKLRNPIYQETAAYGHMGREPQVVTKHFKSRYEGDKDVTVELFTWEKLDYVDKVKAAFGL